ncbi:MAG: GAF domain-containing protein [Balneolaceae bacterium]|nr:GAF domain-containing protein [Balneolaceae bacterium]
MSLDRQEKALREFKQVIEDLVHLLRTSTKSELAYMCWVNHSRQQFVWETNSSGLPNVMFQDRVAFERHFLNDYKDIEEIVRLVVGEDVSKAKLMHYFEFVQARNLLIIPFINKGETVALTVLESEKELDQEAIHDRIAAYNNALVNVLDTYLEVVDLHEQQNEWEEYEKSIDKLDRRAHRSELMGLMLEEMQKYIPNGGVSLLSKGMESWNVVLNASQSQNPPNLGLRMEQKSVAYDALEKGHPIFTMHFNNNPRRIAAAEKRTEGATFAIPVLMEDVREVVVVCYDNDPLTFKESTKHKLSNLARIATLNIQSSFSKGDEHRDLLTHKYGAYIPEVWEAALNNQLERQRKGMAGQTWFGLITPEDVSGMRSKFRLDDLKRMQSDFVAMLNPSNFGIPGYIGFHADYVYAFVIESDNEEAVTEWMEQLKSKLDGGFKLSNGKYIDIAFRAGYTMLSTQTANAYQVVEKAKKALSEAVNNNEMELIEA